MENHLKRIGCPYRKDVPLRNFSSWRIGGPADWMVEPESTETLSALLAACHESGVPFLIIGHGTNLLFDDSGFRGVIIRFGNNFAGFKIEGMRIWAQAGAWVPRLARLAGRAGIGGLEHTIGIPGTLGGLVAMNGGSQRKCIGDCVERILTVDRAGNRRYLTREECGFAYRTSVLQRGELIAAEIELQGRPGDPAAMRREMLAILRDRGGKFPRKQPNCGSVFVSGAEMYDRFGPPGKVIETAGLKGLRIGDAQVSPRHANFIVNLGNAASRDTIALIREVRDRVREFTGLWLECEVRYVSPTGVVMSPVESPGPA